MGEPSRFGTQQDTNMLVGHANEVTIKMLEEDEDPTRRIEFGDTSSKKRKERATRSVHWQNYTKICL